MLSLSIVNNLRKEVTIMITKNQLQIMIEEKDQVIKELLKTIENKNKQIIELLVELGEFYQNEITNQEVNNQN